MPTTSTILGAACWLLATAAAAQPAPPPPPADAAAAGTAATDASFATNDARALLAEGERLARAGDLAGAQKAWTRAGELAEQANDSQIAAAATEAAVVVARQRGDDAEANRLARKGRQHAALVGDVNALAALGPGSSGEAESMRASAPARGAPPASADPGPRPSGIGSGPPSFAPPITPDAPDGSSTVSRRRGRNRSEEGLHAHRLTLTGYQLEPTQSAPVRTVTPDKRQGGLIGFERKMDSDDGFCWVGTYRAALGGQTGSGPVFDAWAGGGFGYDARFLRLEVTVGLGADAISTTIPAPTEYQLVPALVVGWELRAKIRFGSAFRIVGSWLAANRSAGEVGEKRLSAAIEIGSVSLGLQQRTLNGGPETAKTKGSADLLMGTLGLGF